MSAPQLPSSADQADVPPPGSWSAGTISLLLAGGILLLTLIWEGPRELDRWRLTQAVSARARGDKEEAYRLVAGTIDREPDNASLRVLRADWRMADDEPEAALADLDAAVKERPTDVGLRVKRSLIYQKLARHPEAIADLEEVLRLTKGADDQLRILYLNNIAYARAIAEIDVEQGLKEIGEAFKLIESTAKPSRAAERDTRGFLNYRLEKFAEALEDLDAAVNEYEADLALLQNRSRTAPKRVSITKADYERLLKLQRQATAVIRYHRGLAYEKYDEPEKAAEDFQRVRELGFEPNEELR